MEIFQQYLIMKNDKFYQISFKKSRIFQSNSWNSSSAFHQRQTFLIKIPTTISTVPRNSQQMIWLLQSQSNSVFHASYKLYWFYKYFLKPKDILMKDVYLLLTWFFLANLKLWMISWLTSYFKVSSTDSQLPNKKCIET